MITVISGILMFFHLNDYFKRRERRIMRVRLREINRIEEVENRKKILKNLEPKAKNWLKLQMQNKCYTHELSFEDPMISSLGAAGVIQITSSLGRAIGRFFPAEIALEFRLILQEHPDLLD